MSRTINTAILALTLGLPLVGLPQGALTPPGAPGPTMKTLAQIEPRIPIGGLPFAITNSGSYYLTANLAGAAGQSGITISVGDVTLDLAGFQIVGGGGPGGSGIVVAGGVSNVQIANGGALNWGASGIDASAGGGVILRGLRANGNQADGFVVGTGGWVTDCSAQANAGCGIHAVG